jgi:hypothetical protein
MASERRERPWWPELPAQSVFLRHPLGPLANQSPVCCLVEPWKRAADCRSRIAGSRVMSSWAYRIVFQWESQWESGQHLFLVFALDRSSKSSGAPLRCKPLRGPSRTFPSKGDLKQKTRFDQGVHTSSFRCHRFLPPVPAGPARRRGLQGTNGG